MLPNVRLSNALQVREVLEKIFVPTMQGIQVEGETFDPPFPLPWYPDRFGWQINAPRRLLRKSPEFSRFQKFIVSESDLVGSMTPKDKHSMMLTLESHREILAVKRQ